MKKRKSLVNLGKIINAEIEQLNNFISDLGGSENSQIKEMLIAKEAEIQVYDNILLYIKSGATWQFSQDEC